MIDNILWSAFIPGDNHTVYAGFTTYSSDSGDLFCLWIIDDLIGTLDTESFCYKS
jgi:hypothetical protein